VTEKFLSVRNLMAKEELKEWLKNHPDKKPSDWLMENFPKEEIEKELPIKEFLEKNTLNYSLTQAEYVEVTDGEVVFYETALKAVELVRKEENKKAFVVNKALAASYEKEKHEAFEAGRMDEYRVSARKIRVARKEIFDELEFNLIFDAQEGCKILTEEKLEKIKAKVCDR